MNKTVFLLPPLFLVTLVIPLVLSVVAVGFLACWILVQSSHSMVVVPASSTRGQSDGWR